MFVIAHEEIVKDGYAHDFPFKECAYVYLG